jgi:guanylate kinase
MIAAGEFLEWAEVFGNYYGTTWKFLEQARRRGDDLVLDIDVQGAELVRGRIPDAVGIFISPPDRRTLESRLRNRGQDAPEVIERRLQDATREIAAYNKYDYVLVNDRLDDAVEQLWAIVISERARLRGTEISSDPVEAERMHGLAEGCRSHRMEERLRPVLQSFGVTSPDPASKK